MDYPLRSKCEVNNLKTRLNSDRGQLISTQTIGSNRRREAQPCEKNSADSTESGRNLDERDPLGRDQGHMTGENNPVTGVTSCLQLKLSSTT